MKQPIDFEAMARDPRDPNPRLALYLDCSMPSDEQVKAAWLHESCSWSRQFILPAVRPLAPGSIVLPQLLKTAIASAFTSSRLLHRLLARALHTFVRR